MILMFPREHDNDLMELEFDLAIELQQSYSVIFDCINSEQSSSKLKETLLTYTSGVDCEIDRLYIGVCLNIYRKIIAQINVAGIAGMLGKQYKLCGLVINGIVLERI